MAQTAYQFDKPTKVYSSKLDKEFELPVGQHFLSEDYVVGGRPAPTIPFTSPTGIVSSTTGLREQEYKNKVAASKLSADYMASQGLLDSQVERILAQGEQVLGGAVTTQQELDTLRKSLGILNPNEESNVEAAGRRVSNQYDDVIRRTEEAKKQSLARSLIRSGERGGLMNTLETGEAADPLNEGISVPGGGDFYGAGGRLAREKSELDSEINRLYQAKVDAVEAAKAAERKAILTGKRDDYDLMEKSFQNAINISNAIIGLAGQRESMTRNARAEARQAESSRISSEVSILNAIKDIPEGQTVEIGGSVFTGIKPPSVETQAFTDENGNVTIIDKNTGKKIGVVQGIGSKQKAANMQFHEVGNKIFIFDPETGKLQDSGVTTPDKDMNTLLTPAEAKALGVKYGTTRGQAASMGIMPSNVEGTRSFMDTSGNIIEIGSKQLSPAQTQLLSEGKQLTDVLDPLYGIIKDKKSLFGPIRGYFGQKNPYATDAKKIDDDLRRASQVIGKYMEGGVLRKEDEEKYRNMLPQLTDTPEVAKDKLDGVAELLDKKQKQYIMDFGRAGYDVENFVKDATEVEKDPLKIMDEGDPLGLGFNRGDTGPNEGVVRAAVSGSLIEIPQSSRLAYVNNNPGNLRFVGQAGATKGDGGFAKFSTPQAGYQALLNQIKLDASRDLTLEQFINKYAPPSENNTNQYLQQMIHATGAKKDTKIKDIDLNLLGRAIAKKESSTIIG